MTKIVRRMVLVAVLAGAGMVRAEMSYIVEVTDLQKTVTRQVMTAAELKELKKTIEAEARLFPKAVELVKKSWDEAEKASKPGPGEKAVPSMPFPSGTFSPRRCQEKGNFTKQEEAQKRLEQMDAAESDLAARKAKRAGANSVKNTKIQEREAVVLRAALAVQEKIDELVKNPAGAAAKPAEVAGAADKGGDAEKAAAGAKGTAAKPAAGGH
jgi:hypothetical protein